MHTRICSTPRQYLHVSKGRAMVFRSELLVKIGHNLMQNDLLHRAYEGESCVLIAGPFALLVQVLLGIVAAAGLVFKRYCRIVECRYDPKPKRSLLVWFLDVSKQGIGLIVGHVLNMAIAIQLSKVLVKNFDPHGKRQIRADQCAWYCINFVIDSIIGIPLVWVFLTLISWFAMKFDYAALKQSGNYGVVFDNAILAPTKKQYTVLKYWLIQTNVFVLCVLAAKIITTTFTWFLAEPLGEFGSIAFSGLAKYPHMELLFVMVLFPCVANVFVAWIYDNILMKGEGQCIKILCCTYCKMRCRHCYKTAREPTPEGGKAARDKKIAADNSKTR